MKTRQMTFYVYKLKEDQIILIRKSDKFVYLMIMNHTLLNFGKELVKIVKFT